MAVLLGAGQVWRARLRGGPAENVGEVDPGRDGRPPEVLDFAGGYVYKLVRIDPVERKALYDYAPDLSPGHAAAVRADAEAIAEVAAAQGVSVAQVVARAVEGRRRAAGNPHPADVLLAEATRRGVAPEQLIAEHTARQDEGAS